MLFPWYIKYPNQNDEILNLDWILSTIDNLVNEVANFVTLNTIKYADPIQWNITTQYEKNTVVIDPITGSAYISTKPVPSGVGLNNEDYWNIIFTLDVISANKNITLRDDANNILATFESEVDEWLLWQGTLYIVTRAIEVGQSYVVGYNIERYTVERFLKEYITNLRTYVDNTIGDLDDLDTTDKTDVVAAINSLLSDVSGLIGDLTELETTDKDSIVEAINELVSTISTITGNIGSLSDLDTYTKTSIVAAINEIVGYLGDLDNLNTTTKTSLVAAINEVLTTLFNTTGDLSDLDTTVKTDLVAAINESLEIAKQRVILNVKDYGAVGDGVTNDYNAINNAILAATNEGLTEIYFPEGKYYCGNGTFDIDASKISFVGSGASELISSGLTGSTAFITLSSPLSLEQYDFPRVPLKGITLVGNYFTDKTEAGVYGLKVGTDTTLVSPHMAIFNVVIRGFAIGLGLNSAYKTSYYNCSIIACNMGILIPSTGVQQAVPVNLYGCYFECCNTAIYGLAGGYNSLQFFGGAFEYNRSVHNCYTKLVFIGVRFEYDCKASCDSMLNVRPVFQGSVLSGSSTVIKYIGCFFLGLNNFELNVGYWISNPYKATAYNIAPFYIIGGSKVSIEMTDCELVDSNMPSGHYYIETDHFYGKGNYALGAITDKVNPTYVVTETDGFIN